MHTFLIILGIYLGVAIAIPFVDAFIGIGNDEENPQKRLPLPLICFLWPIILPIAGICFLGDGLESAKKKRLAKDKTKERLRIVAEKEVERQRLEEEKILQEVEAEIENETKDTHAA